MTTFRASGSRGTTGTLFEAGVDRYVPVDSTGTTSPAAGLVLSLRSGDVAELEIEVGRPGGGGLARRRVTLTRSGAWLSCAGWDTARASVTWLAAGTVVTYAWTTWPPPSEFPLSLVEAVGAGERAIPDGAIDVAVNVDDAAWFWRTPLATTLDVAAPQVADGSLRPVLGARAVPSVPNTVTWRLQPL